MSTDTNSLFWISSPEIDSLNSFMEINSNDIFFLLQKFKSDNKYVTNMTSLIALFLLAACSNKHNNHCSLTHKLLCTSSFNKLIEEDQEMY